MKPIPAKELARRLDGHLVGRQPAVTGFALDNRDVKPGDAFLAVRGANVDGHRFVDQALAAGASLAIVEEPTSRREIRVDNLVSALARMARTYRDDFEGPVIGITGSAGKTTAKEFVAAALSPLGTILKTEGNRNTELTAPLLWAELPDAKPEAVVVEMGMRGFGQIAHLASFSGPSVGLVTNIGWSHVDLVGSRQGIAKAKGELLLALPKDGLAVLWAEDEFRESLAGRTKARIRTFGFDPAADCRIDSYQADDWTSSEVSGVVHGQPWTVKLGFAGRHMALNAAAAILIARRLGVPPQEAADALAGAKLPPMRMEIRRYKGATILLDAYNASPPSVLAALETLRDLPVEGRRLAVLGEMKELGAFAEEAHRLVGKALEVNNLDEAIFVGEPMRFAMEEAGTVKGSFANDMADVTRFLERLQPGDAVLVKGSRGVALETALAPLEGVTA